MHYLVERVSGDVCLFFPRRGQNFADLFDKALAALLIIFPYKSLIRWWFFACRQDAFATAAHILTNTNIACSLA